MITKEENQKQNQGLFREKASTFFKVDMHVHSCYSQRPSSWILKQIGCAESYTEPLYLYQTLRQRGMDGVTITDHNTIEGCLEIAHLENVFISEEVTSYFPDNCKVHVLVYDISESQHAEIARLRKNIFELVAYLNGEDIIHGVAHPMFSVNGRLQMAHIDQLLLLFKIFELNGARSSQQNAVISRIAGMLTKERINILADKYNLTPRGKRPWEKILISGSDDHSSLYMGMSYTQSRQADSTETFLDNVRFGRVDLQTHDARPETLAQNIYSIMYQFYNKRFQINGWIDDKALTSFLNNCLCTQSYEPESETAAATFETNGNLARFTGGTIPQRFLTNARNIIFSDPELRNIVSQWPSEKIKDGAWWRFVNRLSGIIMHEFADEILNKISDADILYLFSAISSSASLYMMLSPYFISYSLFARDRAFGQDCLKRHDGQTSARKIGTPRVAMFTDTFNEINGVAVAIQSLIEGARLTGKDLTLITCDSGQKQPPGVRTFEPIGKYDLPEYPELKVYYPPFLEILSYCYHQGFTRIHAETPGAMGLTAMAVAHLLNLPFYGTYHTALPQTVMALTGDSKIEDLFWKYVLWFYGRMEKIFVPSAMTAKELIDKGIPAEKIIVHQWGVDTTFFHPDKRNGFYASRYQINDATIKLLYVGRVSPEKNLAVFVPVMRKILQVRSDVCLVVVGDGPYLQEMKRSMNGMPVIFTGYLSGEMLTQAYASSDLFVFPSTIDTMGNVVVEAQSAGVPVIVTDKGGPCENMIDGKTGLVVSANEDLPDRFAAAIMELCDDSALRKTMQNNARDYAMQRSIEKTFLSFWNH